jgi:hypothetical protein
MLILAAVALRRAWTSRAAAAGLHRRQLSPSAAAFGAAGPPVVALRLAAARPRVPRRSAPRRAVRPIAPAARRRDVRAPTEPTRALSILTGQPSLARGHPERDGSGVRGRYGRSCGAGAEGAPLPKLNTL